MAEVILFETSKVQRHLEQQLLLFHGDPPDSDHQFGFMCALASIYAECLNGPVHDDRIAAVLGWAGFNRDTPA